MIRLNEIKMPLGATELEVKKEVSKILKINECDIKEFSLARRSIDSRKKDNIFLVYSANVETDLNEENLIAGFLPNKAFITQKYEYILPENKRKSKFRPVVVGFGPAGMFAALTLAKAGLRPLVLERGGDVDSRTKSVNTFWSQHKLDTESNVQFGEGGAGTFSDGKLTTGIKDPRCREVFIQFAKFGAPEEILYSATPHIGTDRLKTVVKNLREEVIRLGGEVKFNTKLTDLIIANGALQGISYTDETGSYDIETDAVILAIGHSSRDTFEMLYNKNFEITQKPFSVGTRIEHPQEHINKAQYGKFYNSPLLPNADYKLACHPEHGRGLYTFCMCPGGFVVNASSEEGRLAINGMSNHKRNEVNANSALVVTISPKDFGEHPLSGIEFQRQLEELAYINGNGNIPLQLYEDYKLNKVTEKIGAFTPVTKGNYKFSNLNEIFPEYINNSLKEAIEYFGNKISGYNRNDAILLGVESRTSSPVQLKRDENGQSNIEGLYPCGEGAGYAGGITTAAMDGLKTAENIVNKYI